MNISEQNTAMPEQNRFEEDRARRYDDHIIRAIPGYEAMHQMVCAILGGAVPHAAHLLVVAAGTGREILTLGYFNRRWQFTGVDPSGAMLDVARESTNVRGMGERVRLHEGVIDDLPGEQVFDGATALLVMQFLADDGTKLEFLKAIANRLKPGAPLILVDQHGSRPSAAFDQSIEQWGLFQLNQGMAQEEMESGMTRRLAANHYIPEERILALFEEAGFESATRFFQSFVIGGWWARRA